MAENESHYRALLAKFRDARILAVGDIYLDENVFGIVTEVSLEAPIPVLEVQERRYNPGAAGNAACNAASLGAKVYMVGVVGADANADIVRHEFELRGVDTSGIVTDPSVPTNTYGKLRARGHNTPLQEVLRTDTPKPVLLSGDTEAAVITKIRTRAPEVDAIMIGDQAVSTLSAKVLETIVECAAKHGLVTVADSRKRAGIFKGVQVVVPNDAEAALAAGIELTDDASLEVAGKHLLKTAKNALVTRGPKGITIFREDGGLENVPIRPVKAIDVTGAGDTVAAAVTLALVAGGSLHDAAVLGNVAAGVAVKQEGVVTVSLEDLESALFEIQGPDKLKTAGELKPILDRLKKQGKRVVWTNGCFDILHAGHITYLIRARQAGDILVVGLNSDKSVSENKGPNRPVVNERDRALVISALECVDYVIIFDDKTPLRLLAEFEPTVYAKGGDYTVDTIVQEERKLVEGYGGEIAIIAGVEGQGTTQIIDRIRRENGDHPA